MWAETRAFTARVKTMSPARVRKSRVPRHVFILLLWKSVGHSWICFEWRCDALPQAAIESIGFAALRPGPVHARLAVPTRRFNATSKSIPRRSERGLLLTGESPRDSMMVRQEEAWPAGSPGPDEAGTDTTTPGGPDRAPGSGHGRRPPVGQLVFTFRFFDGSGAVTTFQPGASSRRAASISAIGSAWMAFR